MIILFHIQIFYLKNISASFLNISLVLGKHPCYNGKQELEGITVKFDGTEGRSYMYIEDSNNGVMFRKTVQPDDAHMFLGNVEKVNNIQI